MMKNIVRANMGDLRVSIEECPPEWEWLGGRALTARILNKEVSPICHPLGKYSKIIFAPGLLAGTRYPSVGRLSIGFKSPLSQGIKETNVGGTAGDKMGRLGLKAIILESKPAEPRMYILKIDRHGASILPADKLAGLGNNDLLKELKDIYGNDVTVLSTGLPGELGMSVATIACTDINGRQTRHAARGGGGAVMGSKWIKGIVIDDTGTVPLPAQNGEAFKKFVKDYAEWVRGTKTIAALREFGTLGGLSWISNINKSLPVRNFRSGQFEDALKIGSRELVRELKTRKTRFNQPCMPGCLVSCSNIIYDSEDKYITSGLNFETAAMMGANLGISDFSVVAKLDYLCGDYGIDTVELGVTLGVAAEAGLLDFGDNQKIIDLVGETGNGTTLGRVLGQGAAVTAKVFGVYRVPVVKGQGIPAHDPRIENGTGVTYCTSANGPDHTAGLVMWRKGSSSEAMRASREIQVSIAISDSLGLCTAAYTEGIYPMEKTVEMINAQFGTRFTYRELVEMGKAMLKEERAFNINAGLGPSSDRLPDFCYDEPLPPRNLVFDVPNDEIDRFWNF